MSIHDPFRDLGLPRGTVQLSTSYDDFRKAFYYEKTRLRKLSTKIVVEIEHIGSTAIKDMPAKPIIDLAVGLKSWNDFDVAKVLLELLGYTYHGNLKSSGGHVFDLLVNGKACVILHLLPLNSFRWRKYLVFRDYMIAHSSARATYSEIKRGLAASFASDRKMYTAAKRAAILRLEREAFRWSRTRNGI